MKKWLTILGTIGLTATSTTSLISCEKPNNNENKGGSKPEPKPEKTQEPPKDSNWKLITDVQREKGEGHWTKTYIKIIRRYSNANYEILNSKGISGTYTNLKAIYRWDGTDEPQTPTINPNTGEITDWKG